MNSSDLRGCNCLSFIVLPQEVFWPWLYPFVEDNGKIGNPMSPKDLIFLLCWKWFFSFTFYDLHLKVFPPLPCWCLQSVFNEKTVVNATSRIILVNIFSLPWTQLFLSVFRTLHLPMDQQCVWIFLPGPWLQPPNRFLFLLSLLSSMFCSNATSSERNSLVSHWKITPHHSLSHYFIFFPETCICHNLKYTHWLSFRREIPWVHELCFPLYL